MEIQQKIDHYFLLLFLVSQQIIAIVCAIYFFHSAQMLQVIFFIVLSSVILIALAFYCIFKHYSLAEWTLLLALALGCLFLIITSSDQISSMWCLIAVPIFGVLLGHNQGVIILKSIYIATIVILLTKPSSPYVNVKYDGVLILRFLFSYVLLVMFSITMEKFRFTSLRQITASTMAIDMGLQDILTKLPNRHFMEEQLKQKYPPFGADIIEFSIILADLDNCKVFNDRYGREAGDMILKKLAQLLSNELRDEDIIGRWSGNQFILLLPNINQNKAVTIAERIRLKTSQQALESHGDQLKITLSLGVCSTQNSIDLDDLLSVAENCVYQAKQMGRNMVINA